MWCTSPAARWKLSDAALEKKGHVSHCFACHPHNLYHSFISRPFVRGQHFSPSHCLVVVRVHKTCCG